MPAGCQYHVGTSGWHYKHWLGDFYPHKFPPSRMFSWYSSEFDTVEINNSFYRLPEEKTFKTWKELAPPGFTFSVKASRFITHIKRLKDAEDSLNLFFSRAAPLGESLGPVLFQLPPQWKLNLQRLTQFVEILPPSHRCSIEFRDETWCVPEVFALLRGRNIAFCIHDWREMPWPQEITADFTYIRFHGSGTRYGGDYPEERLQAWAERLKTWSASLKAAYVYFNNDIGGHAVRNPRRLRELLGQAASRPMLAA